MFNTEKGVGNILYSIQSPLGVKINVHVELTRGGLPPQATRVRIFGIEFFEDSCLQLKTPMSFRVPICFLIEYLDEMGKFLWNRKGLMFINNKYMKTGQGTLCTCHSY